MQVADRTSFFEQGIRAAIEGNRPLARLHLESALRADAFNADTWLWLGWTADSPGHAASCFKQVRHLQPDHPLASLGWQWSQAMLQAAQPFLSTCDEAPSVDDLADTPHCDHQTTQLAEACVAQPLFDVERFTTEAADFNAHASDWNLKSSDCDDLNDDGTDSDFSLSANFFEPDTEDLIANLNHELESLTEELDAASIEEVTALDSIAADDNNEGDTVDEPCPTSLLAEIEAVETQDLICLDDETRSITLVDPESSMTVALT